MRGRENQYTDVGVVGRKTGLTVGADLALDEDGMEDASAFFSPPAINKRFESSPLVEIQNTPAGQNPESSPQAFVGGRVEVTEDDTTMEIDENSGRDPKDVLASRRKTVHSPRRRATPTSEPSPFVAQQNNRHLQDSPFLSNGQDLPDTSPSPRKPMPTAKKLQPASSPSPAVQKPAPMKAKIAKAKTSTITPAHDVQVTNVEETEPQAPPARTKKPARGRTLLVSSNRRATQIAQEEPTPLESAEQELFDTDVVMEKVEKKKRKLAEEKDFTEKDDTDHHHPSCVQSDDVPIPKRARKGRPPAAVLKDKSNVQPIAVVRSTADQRIEGDKESSVPKQPKKRGRPARADRIIESQAIIADASQTDEMQAEMHHLSDSPAINPDVSMASADAISTKKKQLSNKKAQNKRSAVSDIPLEAQTSLSEDNGKADPGTSKPGRKRKILSPNEKPFAVPVQKITDKRKKSQLQVTESSANEDPPDADDDDASGAGVRRSRRSRIAPLQFWKNERRVFTLKNARSPSGIPSLVQQVLRVEDTPLKAKRRPKKTKSTQASKLSQELTREQSEQPEDEEWEQTGSLLGMVKPYSANPDDSISDQQEEDEEEIAVSRHMMVPKAVFNSDYKFYKTLGKEFMGAGILELKSGSSKRMKSSGRMQLVFYVVSGKVEAVVNELGFRIGAGSQFQVPRGNMYQISNPYQKTAKIFFAQACIPDGYSNVQS